jgi:hypothetical protein
MEDSLDKVRKVAKQAWPGRDMFIRR